MYNDKVRLNPLFPLINTYVVIVRQINEIFKVLVDIREHDARHGYFISSMARLSKTYVLKENE